MQKRTQLALLILGALILLLIGLYFILTPFLGNRQQAASPTAPTVGTPLVTPQGGAKAATSTSPTVTISPTSTEAVALKGENYLENMARNLVERVGSGVNTDGFLGYNDVLTQVTANGKANILAEQQAMQKAHPAQGSFWSITTRAISAKLTTGAFGDQRVVYTVQALQRVTAGGAAATSKAKSIEVTLEKQTGDQYLLDSLKWSDIEL